MWGWPLLATIFSVMPIPGWPSWVVIMLGNRRRSTHHSRHQAFHIRHEPKSGTGRIGRRAVLGGIAGAVIMPYAPQQAATQWVDLKQIAAVDEAAAGIEQLNSLIITVRGETHLAKAYRGPSLDVPVNVKSVSKTLLATLVLIALDKGYFESLSQRALPLLGPYAPKRVAIKANDITIDHLLSMRSGLVRTSGKGYGAWVASGNWVDYVLKQPLLARPGTQMSYSTGDYHLLSAILTARTGQSTHQLAQEWLGTPLGVNIPAWNTDPQGVFMGGNNMELSPEGMQRFGQMALKGGTIGGERILSPQMLSAAWTPRARSPFSGHQYGYGWFQTLMAGMRVYYARGYGGQMIYVVPQRETVIVTTSDDTRPARSSGHGGVLNRLVEERILPAIARS